ncbi:hypothetical protein BDB00DRAFT_857884 [Zychaea mexicana]|uniref:uncharacterized protein n=1 Tax=Zychaea mexicana TaxID=64656 RepID=UPI0022FDBE43|nr:uncharacterized protein BDB00DRAFT_857884 [Zychaea mexicana]KAI9480234.1 hypothetical protein BDB00DRAFT_857884 [Zychaea mexicana]
MNSEQLAMAILQEKKQSQQQREKKQVKRMELKLKAQRLRVMSEIRKELRMKLKTNSETGALPNYSRHYSCTNTHGTIFHLLAVIDALRVCPEDKALVLDIENKALIRFINGHKYLKGIFVKCKKLLKPYVDTLSAQLKSKEMPVRARRFSNYDRLTEVNGAQIL